MDGPAVVYSMSYDPNSKRLFIGGHFDLAGRTNATNIAFFSISGGSWTSLAVSIDGDVLAVEWSNQTNSLYIGGNFQSVNGTACRFACRLAWGGVWTPLTSQSVNGLNATVRSISASPNSQNIYFCGDFGSAGGIVARKAAIWSVASSSWSALGYGFDNNCYSISFDSEDNVLLAGGAFNYSGPIFLGKIAQFVNGK